MKSLSLLMSAAALGACALVSCESRPYPVGFHLEADGGEGGSNFVFKDGKRFYDRTPFLSLVHFQKFASFLNPDGSYCVVFEAKPEMQMRLNTMTHAKIGKHIIPTVSGMRFEPLVIKEPNTDGKLVIWNGLNGYDLYMISKHVEPAQPDIETKRYLKEDPRPPRPKPQAPPANASSPMTRPDIEEIESPQG